MKKLLTAVALTAIATVSPALALSGTLSSSSGKVFVWKNKKSHDEAIQLILAGVHKSNPVLLLPLLACVVPSGTPAVTTDAGFVTHDILVTGGDQAGCRGNIPMEDFQTK